RKEWPQALADLTRAMELAPDLAEARQRLEEVRKATPPSPTASPPPAPSGNSPAPREKAAESLTPAPVAARKRNRKRPAGARKPSPRGPSRSTPAPSSAAAPPAADRPPGPPARGTKRVAAGQLRINCPGCGVMGQVPVDRLNHVFQCKSCGGKFQVFPN